MSRIFLAVWLGRNGINISYPTKIGIETDEGIDVVEARILSFLTSYVDVLFIVDAIISLFLWAIFGVPNQQTMKVGSILRVG